MINLDIQLSCSFHSEALTVGALIEVLQKFPSDLPARICVEDGGSHPIYTLLRDKFDNDEDCEDDMKEAIFLCNKNSEPCSIAECEIPPSEDLGLRKVDAPVHLGIYSDSKHIELACGSWVEPKWGTEDEQHTEDPEVYIADDDRLYTFEPTKATCVSCKTKQGIIAS